MNRVLVTGATGFIGRYCLPLLLEQGYDVHAVTSRQPPPANGGAAWHRCDLLDTEQTSSMFAEVRPSHLLHLAWYAEPGLYWHAVENFAWLEAGVALIRRFRENGGKRIVMAGTCAEYDWNYGFCSEEFTPLRPTTPYGVCKHALQQTLGAFGRATGISTAWGRVFFLYGPKEHPRRLLASVIHSILEGQMARCTHGNQVRDYLHVGDAAAAFVALLGSSGEGPVNIASGQPVTVGELVRTAAACLGRPDLVRFGALPSPAGEAPLIIGDSTKLTRLTGLRPDISLADGIAAIVDSYRETSAS